jgi:hypothetical protein
LKKYITKYYQGLFGPSEENNFSMDETRRDDIPQVSDVENDMLSTPFSKKEVKEAIFRMELNKLPGPDGFPAEFYQTFWDILKGDMMALFSEFHSGNLPLFSLNFGIITLLPKRKESIQIQQYRHICLLNVNFKIFIKVLTDRISLVAQKVIRPSQTAFLPGRYIMEGVVIFHETIHEMHSNKMDGILLKIDFEWLQCPLFIGASRF